MGEAIQLFQDLSLESETQVRPSILTKLRRKETRKLLQEWAKPENQIDIFMRRNLNIYLLAREVLAKRTEDRIIPTTKFMLYLFLETIPAELINPIAIIFRKK